MSVESRPVIPLPEGVTWGFVTGQIIHILSADTADDEDRTPEARGALGAVSFSPLTKLNRVGGVLVLYEVATLRLNSSGFLTNAHGDDAPVALVTGYYNVSVSLEGGGSIPPFTIEVRPEHTLENPLDLVSVLPIEPTPLAPTTVMEVPVGAFEGASLKFINGELVWV